jgi:hypothetical protein
VSDDLVDQVKAVVADAGQAPAVHGLLHHAVGQMVAAVSGDNFPIAAEYSDEER